MFSLKLDAFHLRQKIPQEEFDYVLLTSVLSEYSGVRQKINELLKSNIIIRVKKGLYAFSPEYSRAPVCKEVFANLIYGPSCISLEYALSFYGLIPERVNTITSITPKRNKDFETPIGRFTYRFLSIEKYPYEIDLVTVDDTHSILIASPEKALADYVVLNKITSLNSKQAAYEFLEHDLRIDRDKLEILSKDKFLALNEHYKSKSLAFIIKAI